MGLRDKLRRLERLSKGEMVVIPAADGTVKRFPKSELLPAFLSGLPTTGRDVPEHPLCVAARNSSDPKWRESFYAGSEDTLDRVEDLSE